MKVLVVAPGPHFSVADVCRGWQKGLVAQGCTVRTYQLDDRLDFFVAAHVERDGEFRRVFDTREAAHLANETLRAACFDLWPDLVLIVSGFYVAPETVEIIRSRGIKVAWLFTESPYEDDAQIAKAAAADLAVVNDPTNLAAYRQVTDAVYIPHAYDPDIHRPGGVPVHDFGFVGTGYPSRVEFFEKVDWSGIDARFAGHWATCDEESPLLRFLVHPREVCFENHHTADLYRSVRVSANLYRREAQRDELTDGWAMGPREVELAACGTFFLRHPRPEGDEVLPMLPTFTEPAEFGDLLRWWLDHPVERGEAARAARAAVADRTFTNHAGLLLARMTP